MRTKWILIILAPSLLLLGGTFLALLFLPHPVPKNAPPVQRVYLSNCATCHGANGRGSWRSRVFLMQSANLTDRKAMARLSDEYLFHLIKNGGATIGKPGMPAFGYHLTDNDIQTLVKYVRTLSGSP